MNNDTRNNQNSRYSSANAIPWWSIYSWRETWRAYIWEHGKDKERINLNKLKNYKALAYANPIAQLNKVKEEYKELLAEVRETSTFSYVKDRDKFIAEGLDLVTATINLLLISGLTEQDFDKHIEKLESYKNGKYKR